MAKKVKKKKAKKLTVKKAEEVFNRWIRNRDSEDGYFTCISCSRTLPTSKMNAGHFVPVSMSSFLRFNELNVNGECAGCNGFDLMHLMGYEKNIRAKIGDDKVDWLIQNKRTKAKITQSDLAEIISKYSL